MADEFDPKTAAVRLLRATLTGSPAEQEAALKGAAQQGPEGAEAVLGQLAGLTLNVLQAAQINPDAATRWLDRLLWHMELVKSDG